MKLPLPVIIPNCKCIKEHQIITGRAGSAAGAHEHKILRPVAHLEAFVTTRTRPAGAHRRCMSNTELL